MTRPLVPANLLLSGTREIPAEGASFFNSGYLSYYVPSSGIIKVMWYCPKRISTVPILIDGHIRYLRGALQSIVDEYGVSALMDLIITNKPHVTMRVNVFPSYPHASGKLIYIASEICLIKDKEAELLSKVKDTEKKRKPRSEDQVGCGISVPDCEGWGGWWGEEHYRKIPDLEVVLKPERTD